MGNVCIVMFDPHARSKPDDTDNEEEEEEETSTTSTQTSQSSHGSLSFTKKWVSFSSKRRISMKRTRYSTQPGTLDSPVWQRGILMGERCEPPDFSGLILYDEHGNHVEQFPCKSPKHSTHPALPLVV